MIVRTGHKKYTTEELDLFSQLETHITEIRDQSPEQWERIALSSKAVKAYSGTDLKEETISAFGAKVSKSHLSASPQRPPFPKLLLTYLPSWN